MPLLFNVPFTSIFAPDVSSLGIITSAPAAIVAVTPWATTKLLIVNVFFSAALIVDAPVTVKILLFKSAVSFTFRSACRLKSAVISVAANSRLASAD